MPNKQSALRYVGVCSTPYSGSTMLSMVMNMHPKIATVGEMTGPIGVTDVDQYHCSCGKLLIECDFWHQVQKRLQDENIQFNFDDFALDYTFSSQRWLQKLMDDNTNFPGVDLVRFVLLELNPVSMKHMLKIGERNNAFIRAVLEITDTQVFFDSSAKIAGRVGWMQRFADMHVQAIHLVRDPAGFVYSYMNYKKSKTTLQKAAQLWVNRQRAIHRSLAALPMNASLLVRYEDLCQQPYNTLKQLWQFLDLEMVFRDDQDIYEAYETYSYEHHVIGNAGARKKRADNQRPLELDQRWKTELSKEQIQQIYALTESQRILYDYADPLTS